MILKHLILLKEKGTWYYFTYENASIASQHKQMLYIKIGSFHGPNYEHKPKLGWKQSFIAFASEEFEDMCRKSLEGNYQATWDINHSKIIMKCSVQSCFVLDFASAW